MCEQRATDALLPRVRGDVEVIEKVAFERQHSYDPLAIGGRVQVAVQRDPDLAPLADRIAKESQRLVEWVPLVFREPAVGRALGILPLQSS